MTAGPERWASKAPITAFVASKDMLNEKLITACLVLSVVAVLTPILLLISVKVGFIDRLRQDFIQDPSFREIRPVSADLRPEAFFAAIRGWPDVLFVMPSVMLTPREVDFSAKVQGKTVRDKARLLPSDPADPLLDRLEGTPPEGDNIVITQDIAASSGLRIGDALELGASRIESDKRKRISVPAKVSGILPNGVLPIPTILGTPLLDRQIESYRAGISVPERGWRGLEGEPKQSFESIVVAAPAPLGETLTSTLAIRVGATSTEEAKPADVARMTGLSEASARAGEDAATFLVLKKGGQGYTGRDAEEANAVLRNSEAKAFGTNGPMKASALGAQVGVAGYAPALLSLATVGKGDAVASLGGAYSLSNRVLLPRSLNAAWVQAGSPALIDLALSVPEDWQTKALTVSVQVTGFSDEPNVLVDPHFLAMIKRARLVRLAFDNSNANLVEENAGYRGFRAVGATIDSIPGLVERFRAQGIEVRARSDEIVKLQRLDRSLNILVLVVAAVALAGGYAILTSSFFANVQRKRVDFATMRLLGMSKQKIFNVPISQAAIVALLGFGVSLLSFFVISAILNRFVARELNFDGQLSKLYFWHFVFVGVFVLIGCCLASLMASREATRIDPAQALRAG